MVGVAVTERGLGFLSQVEMREEKELLMMRLLSPWEASQAITPLNVGKVRGNVAENR